MYMCRCIECVLTMCLSVLLYLYLYILILYILNDIHQENPIPSTR